MRAVFEALIVAIVCMTAAQRSFFPGIQIGKKKMEDFDRRGWRVFGYWTLLIALNVSYWRFIKPFVAGYIK